MGKSGNKKTRIIAGFLLGLFLSQIIYPLTVLASDMDLIFCRCSADTQT